MNSVRIYIDEVLDSGRREALIRTIQSLQHVVDVELSEQDFHELVVEYRAQENLPISLIEALRSNGYHPDILSA